MTGRVLPFDSSAHAAADTLLPFYANGTLRGEELEFVSQHVRTCEACQREVEWLRTIYAACAASPALRDAGRAAGNELDEAAARPRRGNAAALVGTWQAAPAWTRWLLAAQLSAIVVLGGWMAVDTRGSASYRTLGATTPSAQMRDAVAIMFDPGITESEVRRLVLNVGGRIVDGPTATDVYVLEIPAERTERALEMLHAERGVRLAERLGPRTTR